MCSDVIDADWFDPTNKEATAKREEVHQQVIKDMILFLNEHNNGIAIMDSTNHTHARREDLHKSVLYLLLSMPTCQQYNHKISLVFVCEPNADPTANRSESYVHRGDQ